MQPTVFRVSASQLNRFELCPSLWAYDYLARVGKDDAKPLPLIEGSYVASLLESYARALVKADDLPDYVAPYVKDLVWRLPHATKGLGVDPGEEIWVEKRFVKKLDGFDVPVEFVGAIDAARFTRDSATIIDHKTAKNVSVALSEEKLATDRQLCAYVWATIPEFKKRNIPVANVSYGHNQFFKDGTPARQITVPVNRDLLFGVVQEKILDTISDMLTVRRQWLDEGGLPMAIGALPKNYGSCSAYGRACPRRELCVRHQSGMDGLATLTGLEDMPISPINPPPHEEPEDMNRLKTTTIEGTKQGISGFGKKDVAETGIS